MHILKGHGTGNDFVVLPDLDGALDLTPELVRALCDRHRGIGADGVLRVVRTKLVDEAADQASGADYFMDYRNADGSIAEMCGNGVRVFARYLTSAGLVPVAEFGVGTRAGIRTVTFDGDNVTVEMGVPTRLSVQPSVSVHNGASYLTSKALEIPNPHVVVELGSTAELASLDLTVKPSVVAPLPHGQNVEFIVRVDDRHIAMRVHERGVGETLSCGTGICAAAVVAAGGATPSVPEQWQVDVPGGTCWVTLQSDGSVQLTGPAVIVADLELSLDWLATVS